MMACCSALRIQNNMTATANAGSPVPCCAQQAVFNHSTPLVLKNKGIQINLMAHMLIMLRFFHLMSNTREMAVVVVLEEAKN